MKKRRITFYLDPYRAVDLRENAKFDGLSISAYLDKLIMEDLHKKIVEGKGFQESVREIESGVELETLDFHEWVDSLKEDD